MPITTSNPIKRLSQKDFGEIAFEVMKNCFDIHNEIGRLFDEKIYKRILATRMPSVTLEVPVDVDFQSFHKQYLLDVLVADGAVFELKAVEKLTGRHRAQLLNYLLLCDLAHGKLINVRPESIEHEFVNTQWRFADRLQFEINCDRWNPTLPNAKRIQDYLIAFLNDVGSGLETHLYQEAIFHSLGGHEKIDSEILVTIAGQTVGQQNMHMLSNGVALKVTTLDRSLDAHELHTRRRLAHTNLQAIAWINLTLKQITFTTLTK